MEYLIWEVKWRQLIKAPAQYTGLVNNYEKAMKMLKNFYGDPRRLVRGGSLNIWPSKAWRGLQILKVWSNMPKKWRGTTCV